MSESAIADFVARILPETAPGAEPVGGRVVLSQRRLVLAADDGKRSIPLEEIFDVAVGNVPPEISEFFDDTVTIDYRHGGDGHTAVIEADADTVERFATLLFRARLSGTRVRFVHPARVGGRVTDAAARGGTLRLPEGALVFETGGEPVRIGLGTVVGFERASREIDGTDRPVLRVAHGPRERTLTTEVAAAEGATMNVLGRYLRREYSAAMADLEDVAVPEEELELLVALHSAGCDPDLPRLLDRDAGEVSRLLDRLAEKGLVPDEGTGLTPEGQMVVRDRHEAVGA